MQPNGLFDFCGLLDWGRLKVKEFISLKDPFFVYFFLFNFSKCPATPAP